MSLLEAVAGVIGETLTYVVGRLVGRVFHLDPKKATAIGEYVLLGITASAAVLVTVIYS